MAGPGSTVQALFEDERPGLVALAWMLLGSREAAEDAVHECMARYGGRATDAVGNPGGYLRQMVVNECRTVLRRRGRTRALAAGDLPAHIDSNLVDLKDAVDRLTPRRRTAVLLRYYCDLPVNEIAVHMGCRPATVSSLLRRGLRDLQEVLR